MRVMTEGYGMESHGMGSHGMGSHGMESHGMKSHGMESYGIKNRESNDTGKIYYVMGKSASGKDSIYKNLLSHIPGLKTVTLYTTRPIRDGEKDGVEYHFTTVEQLEKFQREKKLIEKRTYQTIYGPWSYFTVDDGQISLTGKESYLMIGTLESYGNMKEFFGTDAICPIYIELDDGIRLERALKREMDQKEPKYKELCRRFLADEEDFKEENLLRHGIIRRYRNEDMGACLREICGDICKWRPS